MTFLEFRQHTREHFQAQVLLIPYAIRTALKHTDLVVQTLHEAEGNLVLGVALGRDAVPVPLDHGGELLVRLKPLPLEGRPPLLEEPARGDDPRPRPGGRPPGPTPR